MRTAVVLVLCIAAGWTASGAGSQARTGFDIYVIRADGTGLTRLTTARADEVAPVVSPDGRSIAYMRGGGAAGSSLWIMDVDGRNQRRVAAVDSASLPAWSPDGELIAFTTEWSSCPPEGQSIWSVCVVRPDGTGLRRISAGSMETKYAVWAPDGRSLLAETQRGVELPMTISVVNADGTGQRVVVGRGLPMMPSWAPDGSRFAYAASSGLRVHDLRSGRDGRVLRRADRPLWSPRGPWLVARMNPWLVTIRADGRRLRRLGRGDAASWSADGRRIAFIGDHLYVVRLGGNRARRLTSGRGGRRRFGGEIGRETSPPSWSPDGRRLYFSFRGA